MAELRPGFDIPIKGDARIGYPQSFKATYKLYETVANAVDDAPVDLSTPAAASLASHHASNTIVGLIDLRQVTRLHIRGRTDNSVGTLTVTVIGWGLESGNGAFEAGSVLVKGLVLTASTERDAAAGNYITNEEVYDVGFLAFAHVFVTAESITSLGYIDVAAD